MDYKVIDEGYDYIILEFDLKYGYDEIIKYVVDNLIYDYYSVYDNSDYDFIPINKIHIELRGDY